MTTSTIATCDHGIVARTKRVIMDRDIYDKKWKLGPFAKKKEDLKTQGKLDKYGRVVDNTPEAWKLLFGDADKATNINEVATKVGASTDNGKPAKKAESDEEETEKKRDKKKKEKKDKKDKKKKKKADSDDEESD
jgi:H/ACA ribonucleoprotein complex subunit 4